MNAGNIVKSSTFRLALLYVLLLGTSVVILLGFLYWSTAGYMDRQTDATIQAEIQGLAEQYRRRGLKGLSAIITERVARDSAGASVYLLTDDRWQPIVGNLDRWPGATADAEGWIHFRLRERGPDRAEEHAARGKVFRLRSGLHLLVGRDVRDLDATRALILDALAWGLGLTAALALFGGWLMSAGVVRRLDAINQTSREIMTGDLSRRIPRDGTGDDFDQLANNLNRMLERIEALMQGVRQVSDNIAHDLRTPLTRLRTKLELLRAAKDDTGDHAALVDETIGDAEELLTTFNALLRIARIESGSQRAAFHELDLAALARDAVEFYEPLARERDLSLTLRTSGPVPLRGDRDLLFQALANLLDNAIKYTPDQGRIDVNVQTSNQIPSLTVADSGPGIPASMHDKVFQRFFRIDQSRNTPGCGLGLSMVAAVTQLHGARIKLEDNQPGLKVRLQFRPVVH